MTLYLTYDNVKQRIIIPADTDFTLFIDTFYAEQVEWAKRHGRDASKIRKKTPQEILNIFSKKELENYNKFRNHNVQLLQSVNEDDDHCDEGFIYDCLADNSQYIMAEKKQAVEDLHDRLISGGLSEEQYQLILTCIDKHQEERLEDIAGFMDISVDTLNICLQMAKNKFEKITAKPLVF